MTMLLKADLPKAPHWTMVHGVLILVQLIFGCGSVVGKLGVSKFNPVLFALIRESIAGPILLGIALGKEGMPAVKLKHLWLFILGGFFVFLNQFGFIVGEKLSNAVIGSAWQPTQPIMTAAIAISLGWEPATWAKLLGISVAFGGAAFMVFYGQKIDGGSSLFAGNVLFFINCLATGLYVIVTKPLVKTFKYPAITVTGLSYIWGSLFMAITAVAINTFPNGKGVHFVCPINEDTAITFQCGDYMCSCDVWAVPQNAYLPLAYWILFNSVAAYFLMTWGNQYADASKVLGYTALQPLTSALLSWIIILAVGKSKYPGLKEPGMNALGSLGILTGLALIIYDNRTVKPVEEISLGFIDGGEPNDREGLISQKVTSEHQC